MTFRKRGGRKTVVTPDGAPWAPRPRVDNAMVKALARAFRWQRMLDEGVCGTIEELAQREKVNRGYMSRVLRLTLLAPDIVEAILDGRQPEGMRLEGLIEGFPLEWKSQRNAPCEQLVKEAAQGQDPFALPRGSHDAIPLKSPRKKGQAVGSGSCGAVGAQGYPGT